MSEKYIISETIRLYAKTLKIPTFTGYEEIVRQLAPTDGYGEFLVKLLETEVETRTEKAKVRRIKSAHFPFMKTFEELDLERFEHVSSSELRELTSCDYIDQHQNIVMIGNPGTGKTHLSIALGIKACQRGYNVRFVTASDLLYSMSEARDNRTLMKYIRQVNKADLLILDELSYLQIDKNQADLLFKVISERYERKSTIITTNLSFSEWGTMFGNDDKFVTAMVGRLTYQSRVLNINSEHPYRENDLRVKKEAL